jgi:hypothetical protein
VDSDSVSFFQFTPGDGLQEPIAGAVGGDQDGGQH